MHNSSFKYVNYKDRKEFASGFKYSYTAVNEETGFENLKEVEKKWGDKYSFAFKSWELN